MDPIAAVLRAWRIELDNRCETVQIMLEQGELDPVRAEWEQLALTGEYERRARISELLRAERHESRTVMERAVECYEAYIAACGG